MSKAQLAKLHESINNLYYFLFDVLSEDQKRSLEITLQNIKEQMKGDF